MIKKIPSDKLVPGMYVTDFNTPWFNHPFLTSRRKVRSVRDVQKIIDHGISHVYIDTSRGLDSVHAAAAHEYDQDLDRRLREEAEASLERPARGPEPEAGEPAETAAPGGDEPAATDPFDVELERARALYDEAKRVVRALFDGVARGEPVDGARAHAVVEDMVGSIFRNRDALISLSRIKNYDEYTYEHSINVAVLSLNLGASLGILDEELKRLGVGALLHDVGKLEIPPELVKREGPLSPDEYEVMRSHAARGARQLLEAHDVHDASAAVALNHHERWDGSGYPRGLERASIGKFGLVGAVADVYDAMTTRRPYQAALAPAQALRRLFEWAGALFHPLYVQRFIQCMGVHPIGTVVVLDTGELGVVVRQNRNHLLRPWVRLVTTPDGRRLPSPVDVDLSATEPGDDTAYPRSVDRVQDPSAAGFDPEAVLSRPTHAVTNTPLTAVVH